MVGMEDNDTDEAFTAFVAAHSPSLRRTAYLLTGSTGAAEDLLQDALVRTWLGWQRVVPATAAAYTRRVLVNLATDRWRRRRYRTVTLDGGERWADPAAERAFGAVDDQTFIVEQLAALSPRERAINVLRYYHDLAEADVAEAVGCSVGTVKSTCSRALARIRTRAEAALITSRSTS